MWTLQLWIWGGGVRGKCNMQLWLLSCHSVLPPWVWTLFVRAPSGVHVFDGFSLLPCLHVCAHFSVFFVHAYAYRQTHNQMTTCAYTAPRDTRRTTAGQPRGDPRDHHGTTHGTASGTTVGQPTGQPRDNPDGHHKEGSRGPPPPPAVAFPGRGTCRTGNRTCIELVHKTQGPDRTRRM